MLGRSSLVRIVYFSRSRLSKTEAQRAEQMTKLTRASKRQNEFALIGSVLVHERNWFLQMLEGDREALGRLFQKISADPRHDEVRIVEWREVARRELITSLDFHERNAENGAIFARTGLDEMLRRGTPKPTALLAFMIELHKTRAAKSSIELMA